MKDEEIIEMFWNRLERVIEETNRKYGGLVKHITRSITGNEEDARECENDVYLALWNSIPPKRPPSLQYFVCRLARDISCNRNDYNNRKKRSSAVVALEELAEVLSIGTLESQWENRLIGQAIDAYLETLDQKSRVMFVYRYWYGYSEKEIAGILHMTRNSVALRLSRIRKKLRSYLKEEGIYG